MTLQSDDKSPNNDDAIYSLIISCNRDDNQNQENNNNGIIMFAQTYAADIFFGQSWEDHRLKLPANMTG